jgi:alpha-glucosidase (family GH31 glycosyl hydrolase)
MAKQGEWKFGLYSRSAGLCVEQSQKNNYDIGIRVLWLDEAEPEYSVYDFDIYRYLLGPDVQIGNIYPVMYAKGFYEGMTEAGQKDIINLIRCAWAGSQRYGALVWSGDIDSSFKSLRIQLRAGLNMGLAGIPWWTSDIGGFHGGNPNDRGAIGSSIGGWSYAHGGWSLTSLIGVVMPLLALLYFLTE